MSPVLVVLLAALGAAPAADGPAWTIELSVSAYRPNLDAEFGGTASPFANAFGTGSGALFRLDVDRTLVRFGGPLQVGLGGGWSQRRGHGLLASGEASADTTRLDVFPLRLTLTYRFELLQELGVPLAPYARVALDSYLWRVTDGSGSTASVPSHPGWGETHGYSAAAGLSLSLDGLDPSPGGRFGLTSLYVELSRSEISDFGSARSWDLSHRGLGIAAGLAVSF